MFCTALPSSAGSDRLFSRASARSIAAASFGGLPRIPVAIFSAGDGPALSALSPCSCPCSSSCIRQRGRSSFTDGLARVQKTHATCCRRFESKKPGHLRTPTPPE